MKFASVICEFNPFHNGHAYVLKRARELSGADAVICVMSGDFVQRARPAIAGMRVRANAALLNGADAVIELPALSACACGEKFSEGAVNIINSVPGVTHLVFGSESGDIGYLTKTAEIQLHESESFKNNLKRFLDEGKSYAAAYSNATAAESGDTAPRHPNDLLGAEYIKTLLKSGSAIMPVTVKRAGADYHDAKNQGAFSSATAVRGFFEQEAFSAAQEAMPESAYRLFYDAFRKYPLKEEFFNILAVEALRNRDLSLCPDGGEGLEIKLKKSALQYTDLNKIIAETKSKRYTESRIRRLCLQSLLCVTHYPVIAEFNIPARLIGVKNAVKESVLRALPNNIIVQNKDYERYLKTLPAEQQNAASYIESINRRCARLYPLLCSLDGGYYDSEPLLLV